MDTKETVAISIIVAGIVAVLIFKAGEATAASGGPVTVNNNQAPNIYYPINDYHFAAPDFKPIPITQLTVNNLSGGGPTTIQPGPNTCGCHSDSGVTLAGAQALQDSLNTALAGKFNDYLNTIMAAIPSSISKFLNNAEGAGFYTDSQNAISEFGNSADVSLGLTRNVNKNTQGFTLLGYGATVVGAQFKNTYGV